MCRGMGKECLPGFGLLLHAEIRQTVLLMSVGLCKRMIQVNCGGIGQFIQRKQAKLIFPLIDIDDIFPMQSLKLTKSLYFGSNSKKKPAKKKL